MAKRSKARRRALDILFEAENRDMDPLQVLAKRREAAEHEFNEYIDTLIRGITERGEEIDEHLSTYARGWTLSRMPRVDLMALRIGTWEILFNPEIPDAVAVAEAIDLVRVLSTAESPRFVNGLLGRIQELKPTLIGETPENG